MFRSESGCGSAQLYVRYKCILAAMPPFSSHLPKSAKYALSLCLLLSYRWLKIRIFFLSNKICAQRECTSGWTLSVSRQSFYVNSHP